MILDEPTSSTGESGLAFLRGALAGAARGRAGCRLHQPQTARRCWSCPIGSRSCAAGARSGRATRQARTCPSSPARWSADTALLTRRHVRSEPGEPVLDLEDVDVLRLRRGPLAPRDHARGAPARDPRHRRAWSGTASASSPGSAPGLVEPDAGRSRAPATPATSRRTGGATASRSTCPPPTMRSSTPIAGHRSCAAASSGGAPCASSRSKLLDRFAVDPTVIDRATRPAQLSGGNQQRLVLGRELEESNDLLVLHNPTRGLDVAATAELFRQLDAFCAAAGRSALISPDLDELLEWADAIQVLVDGRLSRAPPGEPRRRGGPRRAHGRRRVTRAARALRARPRSTSGSLVLATTAALVVGALLIASPSASTLSTPTGRSGTAPSARGTRWRRRRSG